MQHREERNLLNLNIDTTTEEGAMVFRTIAMYFNRVGIDFEEFRFTDVQIDILRNRSLGALLTDEIITIEEIFTDNEEQLNNLHAFVNLVTEHRNALDEQRNLQVQEREPVAPNAHMQNQPVNHDNLMPAGFFAQNAMIGQPLAPLHVQLAPLVEFVQFGQLAPLGVAPVGQLALLGQLEQLELEPAPRVGPQIPVAVPQAHPAPVANRNRLFNNAQSTHQASVHEAVSASAIRLFELYSRRIQNRDLTRQIEHLRAYINDLPRDEIINAAQRGLTRITGVVFDNFVDRVSNLTIKQLLALIFVAAQDETRCFGSFEDTMQGVIRGLYEIQRGGNLSETGQDNGGLDAPICTSGTFNKLIESMAGLHTAIEFRFISLESITAKFQALIKEHASAYLNAKQNPQTAQEYLAFVALIEKLKHEGLGVISKHFIEAIRLSMIDEFISQFRNDPSDPRFVGIIDSMEYYDVDNLDLYDYLETAQASPGYQQYLQAQTRFSMFDAAMDSLRDETTQEVALSEETKEEGELSEEKSNNP